MPARCLIVDDEPAAHYVLEKYLAANPKLALAGHSFNGYEAAAFLKDNPVDLMFLDIDMPEITGLELLQQLENPPKTILTTAYSEFALESYDYGVIDYLLKPIFFPRFEKAIARFLEHFDQTAPPQDYITVKVDSDPVEIALGDLRYAQSFGNYVKIFTPHKTWLATMTTNELEHSLPANRFMRIHKSYIVALDAIAAHTATAVQVGDVSLPVGITYRRELTEKLRSLL